MDERHALVRHGYGLPLWGRMLVVLTRVASQQSVCEGEGPADHHRVARGGEPRHLVWQPAAPERRAWLNHVARGSSVMVLEPAGNRIATSYLHPLSAG
jgi:hypothetical protein